MDEGGQDGKWDGKEQLHEHNQQRQLDAPRRNFQNLALTHASHDEEISPDDVPHQQEERVPGRGAEVGAVDGDLGRKNRAEKRETGEPKASEPVWYLRMEHPGYKSTTSQSSRPPSAGTDAPERAAEGGEEREGRHVVGLLEGPVVGGEGAGQRHLAQRDDEVGEPEEHEDVEELQHDEVLVIGGLAAVEREEALGVGAQLGDVAGVEGLERTRDTDGQARTTPWSHL
uniref:Uncharacterized protein n=1 Tax=Taeniopygia guttata TaxID=59729 RepID=A0A674HPU2_TAEGU